MIDHWINQYRSGGILIDTNLLIVLIIGTIDPDLVNKFDRTDSRYTTEDFELLTIIVKEFRTLIVTPHILTEVSNLVGNLYGARLEEFFAAFTLYVTTAEEHYIPSQTLCEWPLCSKYGLADSAMGAIAKGKYLVLTDDFPAFQHLLQTSVDAVNFNHVRDWAELI